MAITHLNIQNSAFWAFWLTTNVFKLLQKLLKKTIIGNFNLKNSLRGILSLMIKTNVFISKNTKKYNILEFFKTFRLWRRFQFYHTTYYTTSVTTPITTPSNFCSKFFLMERFVFESVVEMAIVAYRYWAYTDSSLLL